MITPISDHVERAKQLLLSQYKEVESLGWILESGINQIQYLEDMFVALVTNRAIDTAIGIQLDRLGNIVGIPRIPGQSDESYRFAIRIKIGQNISEGEPESVINAFRTITGASMVYLSDGLHAEIYLSGDIDFTQEQVNTIFREMKKVIAAGVRLGGVGSFDPTEPFTFAGIQAGLGFGTESDPTIGGKLAQMQVRNDIKFAFEGLNPNNGGMGTVYDPLIGGVFI